MLTIKETIILNEFNPNNPGGEMLVNLNNCGVPAIDVRMILDFMEDDMYAMISRKSADVYSIIPTERGIYHFTQIFEKISK